MFRMVAPTSKEWISLLRLTPLILGSILFFSLIDFGLAVTYAWQLYNAPLDGNKRGDSEDKRWSTAWFVLYSGFFPFLSSTHAAIDASLFFFARLSPICTLTVTIFLFVGWIIQVSFWCHCDYAPDPDTCYQFYIVWNPNSEMSDSPSGVSDGITSAKVAFGMIVPLFYIAYLVMAVIALQKTKGSGHVRIDEEEQEEQELHNRPSIENSNSFGVDYFHSDPLRLHPP